MDLFSVVLRLFTSRFVMVRRFLYTTLPNVMAPVSHEVFSCVYLQYRVETLLSVCMWARWACATCYDQYCRF